MFREESPQPPDASTSTSMGPDHLADLRNLPSRSTFSVAGPVASAPPTEAPEAAEVSIADASRNASAAAALESPADVRESGAVTDAGSEIEYEGFSYDATSGYWFNSVEGYFYDADRQLFADSITGQFYKYHDGAYVVA